MSQESVAQDIVPSDVAILDLLRKQESLTVSQLAEVMEVTATAVRQRLTRLMAQGYVDREATKAGRGRPSHQYILTTKGRRKTGSNFADLAIALWQEIRAIEDPEARRGLLQRLSKRLAEIYAGRVEGDTLEDKMESLAELFAERKIPFTVEHEEGSLPILTALACPYPDLAEQDRSICFLERILFSELLGERVSLSKYRLDGESCCTFEVRLQGTS
ncbi:MAG: transcriptional regulator [Planctomycetaceae bacterium]|nr:transcriptional regulator [Planctomycetaceae bacterium]